MTNRYSQEDKCLKSTLTSFQGDAGNGDTCKGSRVVLGVAIWLAPQDVVFFSSMFSCGETILFLLEASWFLQYPGVLHGQGRYITLCCRVVGMTILVLLRMIPWVVLTVIVRALLSP